MRVVQLFVGNGFTSSNFSKPGMLSARRQCPYPPELVKSQILLHAKCILTMSLWKDDDAKALAESFGAKVLLDKTNLYSELIPAIKHFCPSVSHSENRKTLQEKLKTTC